MLTDDELIDRVRRALAEQAGDLEPRAGLLERVRSELEGYRSRNRAGVLLAALGAAVVVAVVVTVIVASGNGGSGGSGGGGPAPVVPASLGPIRAARIAAQAPDPSGGPPWGLRTVRTSRTQACLQIGRVEHGTIGTLGQDGAYSDDGRFHPLPPRDNFPCAGTDVNGNLFLDVFEMGELRNIAFGVLGPDAVSVAYRLHGRTVTEPTGVDGAYIAVVPTSQSCFVFRGVRRCDSGSGGEVTTGTLHAGVITSVRYRSGRVCRLVPPGSSPGFNSYLTGRGGGTGTVPNIVNGPYPGTPAGTFAEFCPAVGYTPIPYHPPHLTTAQVASHVTVTYAVGTKFCYRSEPTGVTNTVVFPCPHGVPRGARSWQNGGQRTLLINASFIAREAADNHHTVYEFSLGRASGPVCQGSADGSGTTIQPVTEGERVVFRDNESPCPGRYEGLITYQPNGGSGDDTLDWSRPIRDGSILVGRFKFTLH